MKKKIIFGCIVAALAFSALALFSNSESKSMTAEINSESSSIQKSADDPVLFAKVAVTKTVTTISKK